MKKNKNTLPIIISISLLVIIILAVAIAILFTPEDKEKHPSERTPTSSETRKRHEEIKNLPNEDDRDKNDTDNDQDDDSDSYKYGKELKYYSVQDLENASGRSISDQEQMIDDLSKISTWKELYDNDKIATEIAKAFRRNRNQSRGILRGMSKGGKNLKVIIIKKGSYIKVNLGTS